MSITLSFLLTKEAIEGALTIGSKSCCLSKMVLWFPKRGSATDIVLPESFFFIGLFTIISLSFLFDGEISFLIIGEITL